MKQQLRKTFRSKLFALLTIGLVSSAAFAQMSGSYTINSGASATSSNFQNWASFWQSLQGLTRDDGGSTWSGGVSAAVTVDVLTDLTETKMIQFPAISGTSSTNKITIKGGGKYVEFGGPNEVISFTGGDYITIENLVIRNTGSSGCIGVRFSNNSDYNTVDKCTIEFNNITSGSTTGCAYVAFSSCNACDMRFGNGDNGSYCTISSCLMRTTNSNSPGPTTGIVLAGNTTTYNSVAVNNTFSGNTIENFFWHGIYVRYGNGIQVLNNDISRKNATSDNANFDLYGIYSTYIGSTNRSVKVEGNYIHDLPYVGSTVGTGPTGIFYGLIMQYNLGTSTYRFSCSNNTLARINASASTFFVSYNIYNDYFDLIGNTFDAIKAPTFNGSSYLFCYGIYSVMSLNYRMNNNTIKNCSGGYFWYCMANFSANSSSTLSEMKGNSITNNNSYYMYLMYVNYANNSQSYPVEVTDNVIKDNIFDYYMFCMNVSSLGYYNVSRNTIMNNKSNGTAGYYCYVMQVQSVYGAWINSNLLVNNSGYYVTYYMQTGCYYNGNYPFEVNQNTIYHDGTGGYAYSNVYGILMTQYNSNTQPVHGNIITIMNTYFCYIYNIYAPSSPFPIDINHNSYYFQNLQNGYYYTNTVGTLYDYASWKAAGVAGSGDYYGPPDFVSVPTNFKSNNFANQNSTPTKASNPMDITGANRNMIASDRGAVESFMDIKASSTNFSVPATVCAGYQVSGGTTFTVQNLFSPDTAYNFNVAYSVNGGTKVTEKVTPKILYNQTGTVTFGTGLQLNQPGTNRIAIFVDIPDDNRTNDSLIFTTVVKPAPGGGKFNISPKPTIAFYQYGKPNDVTVVDAPVYYDVTSPRAHINSDYGTTWTASVTAETAGGSPVSGATVTGASGAADLELKFVTSNVALEDEMITLKLKITDMINGCDTILTRKVLIYPSIVPDFIFPAKICDGDAVSFDNKSTVKSGNMLFEWDFGTGNPADMTEAPSPVFVFPGPGNYKVKMTGKTQPYGFAFSDSAVVNVGPIPIVKFTKLNACQGQALQFTNLTTPITSTYDWDFGDGSAHSTQKDPVHSYASVGAYTVKLKADLNGCISEATQRAYQFSRPKAAFTSLAGKCDNDIFTFDNTSSISDGLFGNNWDFNDGTVSTEFEPEHKFTSFGTKNVKLVVTSEFGCRDSVIKPILVRESPVASFINDPACSLTPTQFTNTTLDVNGALANYNWDFGDGSGSTAKSPTHAWSSLGPKTVLMIVSLDNGCKSSTSKVLTVGVQPKANFAAQNVCAGSPVIFENNTIWAQGAITYDWDFGDNTKSTSSDPQKPYSTNITTTYNVTLKATIAGGCSDQITKQITVNEAPQTCDFVGTPDYTFGYYGMKLEPKNGAGMIGAQTGVSYTWVFDGGGTETGPFAQYNFQQDGSYKVTMRAKVLATGCECVKTMDVVMNRTIVKDLEENGIAVYPNPNSGQFNIELTEGFGKDVLVTITSMAGKVVNVQKLVNNGMLTIQAGDLADGIYTVSVASGERMVSNKITIQK